MNAKLFSGLAVLSLIFGCAPRSVDLSDKMVDVPVYKMKSLDYGDFPDGIFSVLDIVVLDSDEDFLFSQIDKAVCRCGNIYLLDWIQRKIFTYDMEGNALSVLSRKGRGRGEYLQITDFDVDADGHIWICDSQQDRLLEYGPDGLVSFIASGYDLQMLRCLDGNRFLFQLAPWDDSSYSGKELLLSGLTLDVEDAFIEYGDFVDPNYQLPSLGFSDNGTDIFYHQPIDDDVYRINSSGSIDSVYRFDFGRRTVPDAVKRNVELNIDKFSGYTTLAKTVCLHQDYIVGSFYDSRKLKDFIMDRRSGQMYIQTGEYNFLRLVGISDGKAVFWVVPGNELPASFPDEYRSKHESGQEVLAVLDLASLSGKFQ